MSNTVKMQHYVPRFYLRNFAADTSGSTPIVHCFDKPERNQFPTSISNIAGENYFYDIAEDPDQKFESRLAAIEGEFSQAYEILLDSEDLNALDANDRSAIAYSIAVQELRTRENREQLRDMFSKIRSRLEGMPMSDKMEDQMEELRDLDTDEGATRFQREFLQNNAWDLAEIVLEMKWVLYVNDTDMPYWTSDHPIVRHNDIDHSPYGSMGLQSKGIQIYFPLSPTVSLAFCDPTMFNFLQSKSEVEIHHVRFQNSLQVRESTRHVIANTDNFSMAEDFVEDYPKYAEPDRDRVFME